MKKLLIILSLCVASFVWANDSSSIITAKNWLSIVDAGDYAKSWQQTDAIFQSQLTQEKWQGLISGIRTPLGSVVSRAELSVKAYNTLPGVPDGEYMVIQFQTEFQHKHSSIETLTLSKSSGQWLTVGYFIN